MKLEFLGTGAADWNGIPQDGELRRLTSTLIDGCLLIDGTQSIAYALDKIKHVPAMLYTHSHRDHFDADFKAQICPGKAYSHVTWAKEAGNIPLNCLETYDINGYSVTPVPSNHSTERKYECTVNYIIEKYDTRLLYATDGAWLTNAAYHEIKRGKPLTACVFDGTVGDAFKDDWRVFEHNTLPMVRMMVKSMKKAGLLKEDAPIIVTHLARTLHPSQRELEANERGSECPLIIAYDGFTLEV